MKVQKLSFDHTQLLYSIIGDLPALSGSQVHVGTAVFPAGVQTSASPDGITVHEAHHKLVFMLEGTVEATVGDEKIITTAGDMVIVPAGEPHSGYTKSETRLIFILYGDETVTLPGD